MVAMIETTRNLVEAAGAASLAAALQLREQLAGKRVALICSGGNATVPSSPTCSRAQRAAITIGRPP